MANTLSIPYCVRWGHERTRVLKGHPKRVRRQKRAAERLALKTAKPGYFGLRQKIAGSDDPSTSGPNGEPLGT